jgi:hypothetical protein
VVVSSTCRLKTYQEYSTLRARCNTDEKTVMEWAQWVEDMIGPPEECNKFVIRTRESYTKGMFLSTVGWCSKFEGAEIFDWDETSVRITNNRLLEAIKIGRDSMAVASDGEIVGVL